MVVLPAIDTKFEMAGDICLGVRMAACPRTVQKGAACRFLFFHLITSCDNKHGLRTCNTPVGTLVSMDDCIDCPG